MKKRQLGILLGVWIFHLIGILVLKYNFYLPLEVVPLHLSVIIVIHFFIYWFLRLVNKRKEANFIIGLLVFAYFFLFVLGYFVNFISLTEWGNYFSYKTLGIVLRSKEELMTNFSNELLSILILLLFLCLFIYFLAKYISPFLKEIKIGKIGGIVSSLVALVIMVCFIFNVLNFRLRLGLKGEPLYNFIKPTLFSFDEENIKFNYVDEIRSFEKKVASFKGEDKPNIILIVVDALRYDRLSLNGYFRETSPFLDSLSRHKNFVSFSEVRSNCSTSFCGILSLLSGVPIYDLNPSNYKINDALSDMDYNCHFILSGAHNDWYQLRRAYEFHHDLNLYHEGVFNKELPVSDDRALVKVLGDLDFEDDLNNFIYLHMMSTHRAGSKHKEYHRYFPDGPLTYLSPDSLLYSNHYDNGVLQMDHFIKEVFSILDEKGLSEEFMVFITADHGESLGEHELYGHAGNLSEANIRIPLLYFSNSIPLKTDPKYNYTHSDLAPIILNQITNVKNDLLWTQSNINSMSFHQQGFKYALVQNDGDKMFKLWYDQKLDDFKLFELKSDPKEIINLIDRKEFKGVAEELIDELKRGFDLNEN